MHYNSLNIMIKVQILRTYQKLWLDKKVPHPTFKDCISTLWASDLVGQATPR